jgi:pantoate--beta-alanine ligase
VVPLDVIAEIPRLRETLSHHRGPVVLVPTMGALHAGHRACIDEARSVDDATVVVSIFVNPTQFDRGEDLRTYPREFELDLERCREWGCSVVFAPAERDVYPSPQRVWVEVEGLTDVLCGAHRPGHFRGVATVVAKLFHIVDPDIAVFGQKDAQQALVIREMVRQLGMRVSLRLARTVREGDGLAVSSRNVHLDPDARRRATAIHGALALAARRLREGERDPRRVEADVTAHLAAAGIAEVDYAEMRSAEDLSPLGRIDGRVILAIAAHVGGVRLIDNAAFEVRGGDVIEDITIF